MSIATVASRATRFAARALPAILVVVRILFADGRTDVEKSIQNGLRTIADAILRRYSPEPT